jgi:predicted 3-demethylubiquinone-9 3-methyltransferase (glyoxalase superfamily)
MTVVNQRIIPNLWFDFKAEEATEFYSSVFHNIKTGQITRAGKAGFEIHGIPESTVMTIELEIEGVKFIAINGGPLFKFNPTVSFLVACNAKNEVDILWQKLSEKGSVLMDIDTYSFSERYGWIQDKYGISWQLMFRENQEIKQKITPTLMFTGEQWGKAETGVNFYINVFNNSAIDHIMRYGQNEEPDREGTVRHAGFTLEGLDFAAMDSARIHDIAFNEAISFMIECDTQKEIDYYWDRLTRDGGQEGNCGWLKDRFGVSWQVTPTVLREMLLDPEKRKVERVTNVFLKMKRFEIKELMKAYIG